MSGSTLYDYQVGHTVYTTNSHFKQEGSIGKAVWHQFTIVVILRENMQQKSLSSEDIQLQICLKNLQYRAYTQEDIALLESRIAGKSANRPKLNQFRFRNVSVITRLNSDRDEINRLESVTTR